MSRHLPQVVVVCEDSQHEAFVRRFLYAEGFNRDQIRIEKSPKGKVAGEQWVRERYPIEVRTLREKPEIYRVLIVVADGDAGGYRKRMNEMDQALSKRRIQSRQAGEPIALIVPCRTIETWIAYLTGETVDERKVYPKLERERKCKPMVAELKRMCDGGVLRKPVPPSLAAACKEYRAAMKRGTP